MTTKTTFFYMNKIEMSLQIISLSNLSSAQFANRTAGSSGNLDMVGNKSLIVYLRRTFP